MYVCALCCIVATKLLVLDRIVQIAGFLENKQRFMLVDGKLPIRQSQCCRNDMIMMILITISSRDVV